MTYNWDLRDSYGGSIFFPKDSRSFYKGDWLDFATGTDWGASVHSSKSGAAANNLRGPMLVEFVNAVYPDAPDNPDAPPLLKMPTVLKRAYLPMAIMRTDS